MSSFCDQISRLAVAWLIVGFAIPAWTDSAEKSSAQCQMGAAAGARRYRPGFWGVVGVTVVNPTDEASELLAVVYLEDDPTLQYGRKIWVPAKSLLQSTCPIQIPDDISVEKDHVSLVSVPINQQDGSDMPGLSHAELTDRAKPLIVDHDPIAVGILGDFEDLYPFGSNTLTHMGPEYVLPAPDDPVYDVVLAAKLSQGLSRRMSLLNAWELPADPAALDALDVVVLCSDRLADDPNGTALLRNWVLRGGHLWVMVDEVQEGAISTILGEVFATKVVDRVGLTELQMEDVRVEARQENEAILEFDDPVAFARVLPKGVTVTDSVDGWPASFWQPVGDGKVFYTTLGPAAWIGSATSGDVQADDTGREAGDIARPALRLLAEMCFSTQDSRAVDTAAVVPFLAEQIGYRILRKEIVAAVLAIFCVCLSVIGVWFWKTGHMDRLLWVAPSLAAVTTLVFLGVALTARRSVPPTVALWQRVVLEPGLATGQSSGLASLYSPTPCSSNMGATRGGVYFPDMTALRGQRRRMVWADEGVWKWEELELPPGERNAPLDHMVSLEETVDCRAKFGSTGLWGRLAPAPFTGMSDAVVIVPDKPVVAAKIRADGTFTCEPGDMLATNEFMADKWLTDVQQRRRDVYRQLLGNRRDREAYDRLTLFVWADSLDDGFVFPQGNRLGSALVSVPVRVERSTAGSNVLVPAPFIQYRNVVGPDGSRSAAYSPITGEWGELKTPANEWLRFQLPESVLPIELEHAAILLSMRAPSRSVEILAVNQGEPVLVRKLTHPIGSYRVMVDRSEWLELDETGGLMIGIRVGEDESAEPNEVMAQASWLVESLQMEIAGTVQGE